MVQPVFLQSPSLPGCLNAQRWRHQTLHLLCSTMRGASSLCGGRTLERLGVCKLEVHSNGSLEELAISPCRVLLKFLASPLLCLCASLFTVALPLSIPSPMKNGYYSHGGILNCIGEWVVVFLSCVQSDDWF